MNLDLELMKVPFGTLEELVAEPQYAVIPTEYFGNQTGFYGFKVGFPLRLWDACVLPYIEALITTPVTLFGQQLQATGWSARIMPTTPLRSTDQLVWVTFETPSHAQYKRCENNLTCAPGVDAKKLPDLLLHTAVGTLLKLALAGITLEPDQEVRVIDRINYTGKWVELWFEGIHPTVSGEKDGYHRSEKSGNLNQLIDDEDMSSYIINNGIKGVVSVWGKREGGHNYLARLINPAHYG